MDDPAGADEIRRGPYGAAATARSRDPAGVAPVHQRLCLHRPWPRALNDFGAVKQRLDRTIAKLNGGKPLDPWTLHDARRTFRTGLSTLNIPPHIAELCLAHRQPGLARTYDLHRFDQEKRHALNAWAARLLAIV